MGVVMSRPITRSSPLPASREKKRFTPASDGAVEDSLDHETKKRRALHPADQLLHDLNACSDEEHVLTSPTPLSVAMQSSLFDSDDDDDGGLFSVTSSPPNTPEKKSPEKKSKAKKSPEKKSKRNTPERKSKRYTPEKKSTEKKWKRNTPETEKKWKTRGTAEKKSNREAEEKPELIEHGIPTSQKTCKRIPPLYLPVGVKITPAFAAAALGRKNVKVDSHTIEDMMKEMKVDRSTVNEYAAAHIEKQILLYCLDKNVHYIDPNEDEVVKRPIKTFKHVLLSWRGDASPEHAEHMWMAFFGQFDKMKGWEHELEEQFMMEKNWRYLVDDDDDTRKKRRKNCIARLIRQCKVNAVKRLNDAAKNTHRRVIGMKRVNALKQSDPNFKPRKLATFQYDDFVKTIKVWCLYASTNSLSLY